MLRTGPTQHWLGMRRTRSILLPILLLGGACASPPGESIAQVSLEATTGLVEEAISVPDIENDSEFGNSLAISGDKVLVGAPNALIGDIRSGAVFSFRRSGARWAAEGALSHDPLGEGERFGDALALSGDLAAVAATSFATGQSVRIFRRNGDAWDNAEATLVSPAEPGEDPLFGYCVALDPSTVVIGAPMAESQGRVYVYQHDGSAWSHSQTLPSSEDGVDYGLFGIALALDGNRLLVGAPGEEGGVGRAYVFERPGDGGTNQFRWSMVQRLDAPLDTTTSFGSTVAAAPEVLAVGAPQDRGGAGVVHLATNAQGEWEFATSLELGDPYGYFGLSLAFSDAHLFVGAPGALVDDMASGLVQTFSRDEPWTSGETIAPSATGTTFFGTVLAVSAGSTALVTAIPNVYSYLPALGSDCSNDHECDSGHCSEGVCCNSACDEPCFSCLESRTGDNGTNGFCAPVIADTDPRDDCGVASRCGTTGHCDGAGACAVQPEGLDCGDAACASSVASVDRSECDGAGTCRAPDPVPCDEGYACRDNTCATFCESARDCDKETGYYCLDSTCVTGARCSIDRAFAFDEQGKEEPCSPILCSGGSCLERCERTDDCILGLVCDPYNGKCVTEASLAASPERGGVACQAARSTPENTAPLWIGLAMMSLRRRRRHHGNPSDSMLESA